MFYEDTVMLENRDVYVSDFELHKYKETEKSWIEFLKKMNNSK